MSVQCHICKLEESSYLRMCSCSLRYISVLLFNPEDALCLLLEREKEKERGGEEREGV